MNNKSYYIDDKGLDIMQQRKIRIRFRVYLLCLYLLILPIDATLGNIFGPTSLINYLIIIYVGTRLFTLLKEKILIKNLSRCVIYFLYTLYWIISICWTISGGVNSWYITSLLGCFMMFALAVIDRYTYNEYQLLIKSIIGSGIVVIIVVL